MEKKKVKIWQWIFLVFLAAGSAIILHNKQNPPFQHSQGFIFGTTFNVTYQYPDNLDEEILAKLNEVDLALSPFNKKSLITAINNSKGTTIPLSINNHKPSIIKHFTNVINLASDVSARTNGAFDITVAPLVNAWGFGFKHDVLPDKHTLDSLMLLVGYKRVRLTENTFVKDDPRIMLDCSAIAKGYGSDVVARFLEQKGITNYMVEIGGEIVVRGKNDKGTLWNVGVTKPTDDSLSINTQLQTILQLTDKGMATSGNYRNFYYKGGKKFAHTIDPHTGYPVQHTLLSATVVTDLNSSVPTAGHGSIGSCAEADAYATAFMVMGIEKAKQLLSHTPWLKAYFIFSGENGEYKTLSTIKHP